jgi:large subunit ribosomal protein L24
MQAAARPAVTGALDLTADVEATGLSPLALIGSLRGSGTIKLSDAKLSGLDPRAFDAVTRAVDQGISVEADRIADVVRKALASGRLSVEQAEGAFTVNAGQVRLSEVAALSKDARLSLSGNLDLLDGSLSARLVLSGASRTDGVRPDIFMALRGPMTAPSRTIDVSALTGWLTLRAIENQAQRVRELEEAARRHREAEQKRLEEERQRQAAERQRQEDERKRREAAERQRLEEERARREAAQQQSAPAPLPPVNSSAPTGDGRFAPPDPASPRRGPVNGSVPASTQPRSIERQAPPLPAPIDISPPPGGRGSDATHLPWAPRVLQPAASVGPQR